MGLAPHLSDSNPDVLRSGALSASQTDTDIIKPRHKQVNSMVDLKAFICTINYYRHIYICIIR